MKAIVLEGGGGKGAYQMGALLALRYAGETFDLITGSSVGALNGYLLATDQLGSGFALWWDMSPFSVLALHRLSLLTLLLMPLYGLEQAIASIRGMRYQNKGQAKDSLCIKFGCLPFIIAIVLGLISLRPGSHVNFREAAWLGCILLATSVLMAMPDIFVLSGLSVFVPRPLKTLIHEVVQQPGARTLMLITVTEMVNCFDPDRPEIVGNSRSGRVTTDSVQPFPEYVNATNKQPAEIEQLLLASSALPHGVFPSIGVSEKQYVDGGFSDNLPIYPALEYGSVDDVMVISLRPTTWDDVRTKWTKADRRVRLRAMSISEAMGRRSAFLI
jgi:hypothetical protein